MIDVRGLRAALEHACPDSEIDTRDWPGGPAVVLRRGDRAAEVFWHREKSVFRVRYSWPRMFMNRVHRTDLAEAAGSAATWLSGATPREFAAAWPFVLSDKKRASTKLKLPVVTGEGRGDVVSISLDALRDALLA